MVDGAPHKVLVIGGGFGGLPAVRLLARARVGVEITLLDRRNHHLFQPLLYQVATGILSPGQIAPVLRHVLRKHEHVRVELAEVTGFDLERRVVRTSSLGVEDRLFSYDSMIVAAGAGQSYFGHDEYALLAPGMKTIDDALELRRRVYGAFELAENAKDRSEQRFWLTLVVVGAGPTGVELAGQVRELAVRSLRREFRRIDPSSVRVLLLDGCPAPLANFGDRLSERAATELSRMGVELRMGTKVTGVDALGVDVEGPEGAEGPEGKERIAAGTVIWAAGVQASPLAAMLAKATGAETDRAGRVAVLADLTLPGHPEVFAVGDMAAIDNLPGVCEVAMQGGLHAANTIRRRLKGDGGAVPFKYRDVGSAASVGRFKAIVSVRGLHLSGFPGWVVWMFVHITFLNGYANRVSTLYRWARAMVGRSRPERVFSVGHTGGDLSLPEKVRAEVMPNPFPALAEYRQALQTVRDRGAAPGGAGSSEGAGSTGQGDAPGGAGSGEAEAPRHDR